MKKNGNLRMKSKYETGMVISIYSKCYHYLRRVTVNLMRRAKSR